jgi:excinuclease UvrABC ATPase subunit
MDDKIRVRLGDSVETALRWGEGVMFTLHQLAGCSRQSPKSKAKSRRSSLRPRRQRRLDRNAALEQNVFAGDRQKLRSADAETFFLQRARPARAPSATASARKWFLTRHLVVPDPNCRSRRDPAVAARGQADEHLLQGHAALRRRAFQRQLETPYKDLPDDFKKVLLHGSGGDEMEFKFWRAGKVSSIDRPFEGVLPNLERLATDSESEFIRNRLKAYMSPQFCDACGGRRLKPEILAVTLGGEGFFAIQNQKFKIKNSRPVHHGRLRVVRGKGR